MVSESTLVIVAHPDDEVIGCGGTIARLAFQGGKVSLLLLGGITTSRFKGDSKEEDWKKEAFRYEVEEASKLLGIATFKCEDLPDNRFDTIPLLEVIKKVEKYRDKIKPDLIITHDHSDLNIDHRITHQAVMTAFRPHTNYKRFRIMTCEILSSTECQDQVASSFHPNYYVDIKESINKKIEAMKYYKSELRAYPHPRSLEGIEYQARKRGMEVCLEFAEAFRIVRDVW